MRSDRVMRWPMPTLKEYALSYPQGGRPPKHGKEFRFARPDTWGEPVYHFRTVVRQSGRFADASRKAAFASFSSELEPVFLDLADELKVRTQLHESRRAASVR